MARDLELLWEAEDGRAGARVYSWSGLWVSLGRRQRPEEVLLEPETTRWISRPTGGGAVLHGHDVTLAIALPMRRSVRHSYRVAAQPIIDAFERLGLPVALAENLLVPERTTLQNDCFAGASANDLIDPATLRKVCGCALRRTANAVLLQASIPAGDPLRHPSEVIRGGVVVPASRIRAEPFAAALDEALSKGFVAANIASGNRTRGTLSAS